MDARAGASPNRRNVRVLFCICYFLSFFSLLPPEFLLHFYSVSSSTRIRRCNMRCEYMACGRRLFARLYIDTPYRVIFDTLLAVHDRHRHRSHSFEFQIAAWIESNTRTRVVCTVKNFNCITIISSVCMCRFNFNYRFIRAPPPSFSAWFSTPPPPPLPLLSPFQLEFGISIWWEFNNGHHYFFRWFWFPLPDRISDIECAARTKKNPHERIFSALFSRLTEKRC